MEFNNQYLKYEEYQALGGQLAEMPFNILEFKARKIVDTNTLGRLINLKEQLQEVKMCIFELINAVDVNEKTTGKTSESIDGYSVSYGDSTTHNKHYHDIVWNYLINCRLEDGTPYLYLGV